MQNLTNLLGFIIGDNVIQGIGQDDAGPYVKAAVRDMKAYINQKDYRMIPIGYVNDLLVRNNFVIDPASKRTWEYLNCGNANETIDFFGGMPPLSVKIAHIKALGTRILRMNYQIILYRLS